MANFQFSPGDFIGDQYEVINILGRGGFGEVYLVVAIETDDIFALKLISARRLVDLEIRREFEREALLMVKLGYHPNLVQVAFVDTYTSQLCIVMEYVNLDELGINSLEDYLKRKPVTQRQSLIWGIQICDGMGYAIEHGLRAHRDLKPANILLSGDGIAKISDFGLALLVNAAASGSRDASGLYPDDYGLGLSSYGQGGGTPLYMAPEQFTNAAACDQRSDIYALGVILYQMVSKGNLPLQAALPVDDSEAELIRYWLDMEALHRTSVPPMVPSILNPIIQRCLSKDPALRYPTFTELRADLAALLKTEYNEDVTPAQPVQMDAHRWSDRGRSLNSLNRFAEALKCLDKAVALDPSSPAAWNNRGMSLDNLGRYSEALECYDRSLALKPDYAIAWSNKGVTLSNLGRLSEAIACCDRALACETLDVVALNNKGLFLTNLKAYDEALSVLDAAVSFDPFYAYAWINRGNCLDYMGRLEDALESYDRALGLDSTDSQTWYEKGICLHGANRLEEALLAIDKALEIDSQMLAAWWHKGEIEEALGQARAAIRSYRTFIKLAGDEPEALDDVEELRTRIKRLKEG